MEKVSVVIPVYNSEGTVRTVVEALHETMRSRIDYEVILVDDHSTDGSLGVCKQLAEEFPFVRCVHLSRNFGQQNAKLAGLHYVTGDYVVYMDDDLQNPPELIFRLIDEIRKGYDVVYTRSGRKEQSLLKNLGSLGNDMMARWLLRKPRGLRLSSYYIFTRLISDELRKFSGPFPYPSGTIFQLTTNIGTVEVPHRKREIGRSHYTFRKMLALWMHGFVGFSIAPLRLASLVGVTLSVFGVTLGAVLLVQKLVSPETVLGGWTSVMVAILVLSGAQLLFLGVLGEYVGRILLMVNGKPQFLVKQVYGGGGDESPKDGDRQVA